MTDSPTKTIVNQPLSRASLKGSVPTMTTPTAQETQDSVSDARALLEAYFTAVFEMVDPKIFADDLIECLSAKGFKIVRELDQK